MPPCRGYGLDGAARQMEVNSGLGGYQAETSFSTLLASVRLRTEHSVPTEHKVALMFPLYLFYTSLIPP
jgi:hypothetical protein